MGYPLQFVPPQGRRPNSDGTIDIICRICEQKICRQVYTGFSTALCAHCSGELERGMRPEDIIAKKLQGEEKQRLEAYDDLGNQKFKVHGIGKRIIHMIEEVKKKATARRRGKLMDHKD